MLPFSVDWFMTWLPNIHSSLFYNVYSFLNAHTASRGIRATIDAYRLYLEHAGVESQADEPVLSFTRDWMLVRLFDSGGSDERRLGKDGVSTWRCRWWT